MKSMKKRKQNAEKLKNALILSSRTSLLLLLVTFVLNFDCQIVSLFDKEIVTSNDNPTIGLILCTKKSDAMVKYTLGEKAKQIFASKYQFHLPTEKELEAELKQEIKEIEGLTGKGSER